VSLRVLAVASVVLAVVVLRRLVPPTQRALVTWVACSPLVLLQVVAAEHLEGLVSLLLLTALLLHARHRPLAAGAVVVLAAEVKVTALVALVALTVHALRAGRRQVATRLLTGAALSAAAGVLLLPADPFGWVRGLSTPTSSWDPFALASTCYLAAGKVLTALHLSSPPGLRPALQLTVLLLGAAAALWVLLRTGRDPAWSVAALVLVVTLANPVLWPWYLVPAALLLLAAGRTTAAATLGAGAALTALPLHVVAAQRTAVTAEVTGLLLLLLARRFAPQPPGSGAAPDAPEPSIGLLSAGRPADC